MNDTARLSMPWVVTTAVVLALNTWATLSDRVVGWLSGGDGDAGETWVPALVLWLLDARPAVGDADLHVAVWFVAGVAATLAVRRMALLVWVIAAIWAWSVVLEALQPLVSEMRTAQLIDVLGNTVGVVLGVSVVLWWRERRVPHAMRAVIVGVALATATVAMWSTRMRIWWGAQSGLRRDPAVPAPLQPPARAVLEVRPNTGEADAHALLWFGVGMIVLWAIGAFAWRQRSGGWVRAKVMVAALAGLCVISVLIEILQPMVSSRGASINDVVGNVVGLAAALGVALLWGLARQAWSAGARPSDAPEPPEAPEPAEPAEAERSARTLGVVDLDDGAGHELRRR